MRKIFISAHNDDEALFGAFTIMANRDDDIEVVIVYDSYVQVERGFKGCTSEIRRHESIEALKIMGIPKDRIIFLGIDDTTFSEDEVELKLMQFTETEAWAPAREFSGNRHHNLVSSAVSLIWRPADVTYYMTYTENGKSKGSRRVIPGCWEDVAKKLQALACYRSQIEIPDCRPHFLREQEEYYK